MSEKQITKQVLALPLKSRVRLAEALWQSIGHAPDSTDAEEERAAIAEAKRRNAEIESGVVQGRPHHDVMRSARRTLK